MELSELRERIDQIDHNLTDLIAQRLDVVAQVAEYKKAKGLPVLDSGRERERGLRLPHCGSARA